MNTDLNTVKVWDPLVRIGHWTLVVTFVTAYLTGEESLNLHIWSGYALAIVIIVRIVWGFIGSRHARFSEFVRAPGATLRYLGQVAGGGAKRYIGHNPAGGAMVIALLISLTVTTISGLEIYAIEEKAGPLATFVDATNPAPVLPALIASANASEDDDENGGGEGAEEFWEELHEIAANVTLLLVLLHIAGVLITGVKHRENLVRAMFTGRKRA